MPWSQARIGCSSRTATWLAGLEMTAAFVLAAGALLMLQSFTALTRTDLRFRHERLLTVRLELPQDRYSTPAARARFGDQALERLRALPGVDDAIIWGPSMFARSTWVAMLTPDGQVVRDDSERLMVSRHSTNPGALAELEIPILSGRDIAETDTLDPPPVALVSEATAARLWPGQDAVGRRFRADSGPTVTTVTVIGVTADARHRGRFRFSQGPAAHEPQFDIYLPFAQRPNRLVTLGVRTAGDPAGHIHAARAAMAELHPTLPLYVIAPLDSRMRLEESGVGFAALLMTLYGGLAMALAAIGVYGVAIRAHLI